MRAPSSWPLMPEGWTWDPTLFGGSAAFYAQGRLPYPSGLADTLRDALALDGTGRLLDVGCGPGTVALRLAHLFEEVVGLDADADMVAEAQRQAPPHATFVTAMAEDLDRLGLGTFRVITMAQSFHWMDRERVAGALRNVLAPGGAVVHVDGRTNVVPTELRAVIERRLGPVPRAGQGHLRHGTPSGEPEVLRAAGFGDPAVVVVPGGEVVVRSADDVIAGVWATSGSAPHLFGDDLPAVEAELRAALGDGPFTEQLGDTRLVVYRLRSEPG